MVKQTPKEVDGAGGVDNPTLEVRIVAKGNKKNG